jgi:hypothetical protein
MFNLETGYLESISMPRVSRMVFLMRTALASVLTFSAAGHVTADQHTDAAVAYQAALEVGTVEALEAFIALYPLSDEANVAFRSIVFTARDSDVVDRSSDGTAFADLELGENLLTSGFVNPY